VQKRVDYAFAPCMTATEGRHIAAAYYGRPGLRLLGRLLDIGRQASSRPNGFRPTDGIVAGAPVLALSIPSQSPGTASLTDTPVPIEKMKSLPKPSMPAAMQRGD
jgi:hypothetical protein